MERLYGIHPVREALRARRRALHRLRLRKGPTRGELETIRALASDAGIPIEETDPQALAALVEQRPTQGVVLEAEPLAAVPLDALGTGVPAPRTLVALDGVEDPQNVGAVIRVAESAGAAGLLLTRRHAPPLGPAVARASAGALEWLPAARVPNLRRALNQLKSRGFWIFGCDPDGTQELFALEDRALRGDRVVVLGAEGRGLRPGTRRELDHCVRIPRRGRVGSLNVSAAAAIVLYELGRRDRVAAPA